MYAALVPRLTSTSMLDRGRGSRAACGWPSQASSAQAQVTCIPPQAAKHGTRCGCMCQLRLQLQLPALSSQHPQPNQIAIRAHLPARSAW